MGVRVREKKKGSGVWWVFVNHARKRKAKLVGSKEEARKVASEIRRRLAEGDFGIKGDAPAFAKLAEEWLAKYPVVRSIRCSTEENYRSFTVRHLIPFFGAMPTSAITAETVENFIAAKRSASGSTRFEGRPLSPSSLRVGLVALRLILDRAVGLGYVPVNPAARIGRFPRVGEETVDPFTTKELVAILTAAPEAVSADFATMLRLWAQTGLRAGEVCGLQWQDLDLEAGTALVQRTYSRQRVGPTKTGRVRKVSLLHPVADETAEWRPGSTAEARSVLTGLRRLTVRSLEPAAFVFGRGDGPMTSADLHRDWRRVLRAARVRYRSPEQLRHTFASTMLSRNAPLLYVQQQGGWRSAAILLRVYARWMPQEVVGTVAPAQPAATPAQPALEAVSVTR